QTGRALPASALGIPASLQASLLARLDRLGLAKEVAQIGATIGREFSYELIAAVADRSDDALRAGLGQLVLSHPELVASHYAQAGLAEKADRLCSTLRLRHNL